MRIPLDRRSVLKAGLSTLAADAFAAPSAIDETLRTGIANRKIPCAVGMFGDAAKIRYSGAFGIRDSSGVPVKLDSIFAIASMTKPLTTVAALQLVERGKLSLDEPASKYLPKLANIEVMAGFDASGAPILKPAKKAVTLRNLLTHTSGFCYSLWDQDAFKFQQSAIGAAYTKAGPLMFEPGTRWQYGQGIDRAGEIVEAVSGMSLEDYFQKNICGPLGMADTSFFMPESKFDRYVSEYDRQPDGSLTQDERKLPDRPQTFSGGGGLYSTAPDYVRFMQMILNRGRGFGSIRILSEQSIAEMEKNQIGKLTAGKMKSFRPAASSDVDIQPGSIEKWSLGFLVNTTPYKGGRAAGGLAWAGIYNTFFWIDPARQRCGVLLMQFLPFVDKEAVGLLDDFERACYAGA